MKISLTCSHRSADQSTETLPALPGEPRTVPKGPSKTVSFESSTSDVTSEARKDEVKVLRDLSAFGASSEQQAFH